MVFNSVYKCLKVFNSTQKLLHKRSWTLTKLIHVWNMDHHHSVALAAKSTKNTIKKSVKLKQEKELTYWHFQHKIQNVELLRSRERK